VRLERLIAVHRARFGGVPVLVARAPGRINLIGEHTDYNQGFVLPAAIDRDVLLVAGPRNDRRLRLHSLTLNEEAELNLDLLRPARQWHDYLAGVAAALEGAGYVLHGLDATLDSTVPLGSGLSSSAALEVATALAFANASELTLSHHELVRLCQRAEQEFVGAAVGIMDPFISLFGQCDHALFLDCRSMVAEPVRLAMPDLAFAVCYSGVKHRLASGEYNRRRQECAEAVAILRSIFPHIQSLRDVTPAMMEVAHAAFSPPHGSSLLEQRVRHVVTENARVLETVAAIRARDWITVGEALSASHASLRDNYGVSIPEIDTLVEIARGVEGVLGSRLMGGGFGGSTLTLLRRGALAEFVAVVRAEYRAQTGHEAMIYPVEIVDGASVMSLEKGGA
jgi:galactokinase